MEGEHGFRSAAVLTTGCRLNQAESDALRRRLVKQGVVLVPDIEQAEVCYLNTCAVTAAAGRSSIQQMRKVCRLRPKPRVVVLGCLVHYDPNRVAQIEGVDEVWDNCRKQRETREICPLPARSRAILKVQDGCDCGCSFCVVSTLRGRPWSLEPELVCRQADELVGAGYEEIVLTGLNLGRYRAADGRELADLLDALLKHGGFRIRLASIEPDCFSERLLEILAEERVCPHYHVPLQSGDDEVLVAMGRRYRAEEYARLLERLVQQRPDACIGADVIAGFPGETAVSFERTMSLLESLPLAYLHSFSYSARKGNRAQAFGDPVPVRVKQERVANLRRFSASRSLRFRRRFVGDVRKAVVESHSRATTDNYLRLELESGARCEPGRLECFRISERAGKLSGWPVADQRSVPVGVT